MPPVRAAGQLVCPCGITFEPLPWFDTDRDEPICDSCADAYATDVSAMAAL